MRRKISRLTNHTLFKGSLVVLIGTTFGNFLNYLYHLVSGRLLTPSEYGLLQSLISLTYFQSIIIGAFSTAVVEKIGSLQRSEVRTEIENLQKLSLKLSFGFWLLNLLFFPLINKLLHLNNFQLFFIFSLQSLLSFLPAVYSSTLRARLKFTKSTAVSVLSTLTKLISAFILLKLGLGVIGGLSSWLIWKITSFITAGILVRNLWKKNIQTKVKKIDLNFFKFSFLSLIVNFALTSIYTIDVIFARYYLTSHQAGIYSAISNLGKIIFFGATTILTVGFPMFIKFRQENDKLKQTLKLSLVFSIIIGVGGIIIYNLFPNLIIKLLYGDKYLQANLYLGRFALFISLFTIFNLLIRFLLSLKSKVSAYLSFTTAGLQIILILINHQNIESIINNSLLVVAGGLIVSFWLVIKSVNEA